jgi:hypothetical protein
MFKTRDPCQDHLEICPVGESKQKRKKYYTNQIKILGKICDKIKISTNYCPHLKKLRAFIMLYDD